MDSLLSAVAFVWSSYVAELTLAGVPAESISVIGEDAVGYAMCEVGLFIDI